MHFKHPITNNKQLKHFFFLASSMPICVFCSHSCVYKKRNAGDFFCALCMAYVRKKQTKKPRWWRWMMLKKSNVWRDATSCTVFTVVTMQKKKNCICFFLSLKKCHSLCCIEVFHDAQPFMKGMNCVLRVIWEDSHKVDKWWMDGGIHIFTSLFVRVRKTTYYIAL